MIVRQRDQFCLINRTSCNGSKYVNTGDQCTDFNSIKCPIGKWYNLPSREGLVEASAARVAERGTLAVRTHRLRTRTLRLRAHNSVVTCPAERRVLLDVTLEKCTLGIGLSFVLVYRA